MLLEAVKSLDVGMHWSDLGLCERGILNLQPLLSVQASIQAIDRVPRRLP